MANTTKALDGCIFDRRLKDLKGSCKVSFNPVIHFFKAWNAHCTGNQHSDFLRHWQWTNKCSAFYGTHRMSFRKESWDRICDRLFGDASFFSVMLSWEKFKWFRLRLQLSILAPSLLSGRLRRREKMKLAPVTRLWVQILWFEEVLLGSGVLSGPEKAPRLPSNWNIPAVPDTDPGKMFRIVGLQLSASLLFKLCSQSFDCFTMRRFVRHDLWGNPFCRRMNCFGPFVFLLTLIMLDTLSCTIWAWIHSSLTFVPF